MASLLDGFQMSAEPSGLLALTPEEQQQAKTLGLLALASGMIRGDFGGGLAGFGQAYQSAQDNAVKGKLQAIQAQDIAQQVELRKQQAAQMQRRNDMINGWLGQMDQSVPQANQAVIAQTGNLSPTVGNAALQTQAVQRLNADNPIAGIPRSAITADLTFNDGKNIAEWMFKRGTPDMQVANGYAYDRNRLPPGFMPQLNVSQDGKSTLVTVGPNGMPIVSAPQGAQNTYAGYRNIDESAKANFDPVTLTPRGENPQITTRAALVGNPAVNRVPGNDDPQRTAILQTELKAAQDRLAQIQLDPRATPEILRRAQSDVIELNKQLGNKGSVGLQLQSDAEKEQAVKTAEANVGRDTQNKKDSQRFGQMQASIDRAIELLQAGPTASGVGSLVDSTANFFGQNTKGAELASQLDTLGGWLKANVPRMEGPQSDRDVMNYAIMAGAVGDRSIPVQQRLAAAQEVKNLQLKYAQLNGYAPNAKASQPEASQRQTINALPATAAKGARVRDTATGKILQFNGQSWVEEK